MNARTLGFLLICTALVYPVSAQDKTAPEFVALKEQFDAKVKTEVQQVHDLAVADLNTKYTAALDRAQESAQTAGKLEDAVGIKKDKEEFALGNVVPAVDDTTTPLVVKQLRGNYRLAISRIEADRDTKLRTLQAAFGKALDTLVVSLTKQGKLEEAMAVKKHRDGLPSVGPSVVATTAVQPNVTIAPGANGAPFVNSLGMKFVPIKGSDVLFCIHEVRYRDYSVYAAEAPGVDGSWTNQTVQGFTPTDRPEDHPVASVNWDEAQAFCAWLSRKEGRAYRLPTDQEWSIAAGVGSAEKWDSDTTPATVSKDQSKFPWGVEWPPPKGAGNYSDESRHAKAPGDNRPWIEGYDDTFPTTAPVMSFEPNEAGLYDMGGNVFEWVEDWNNDTKTHRVLRGGSWDYAKRNDMLASGRGHDEPNKRMGGGGFRVVLESSGVLVDSPPKANPALIAFDFDVAFTRQKDDHRKAMEGNKIVVYETWKYGIKIENKSKTGSAAGVTASGLELRYNIAKTPKARGMQARVVDERLVPVAGLLIKAGAVELVDIKPQSTIEAVTDVIPITHSELAPGWYYTDGTKDEHNDELEGIWIQLVKDGNVVFEKKQGSKAAEGAQWVTPPKPTSSSN